MNTGKFVPIFFITISIIIINQSCASHNYDDLMYVDNGNGTVTDNAKNLVWKKCSQGQNNDNACSGTASTFQYCTTNDDACDNGTIVTSGPLYDTCDFLNTNPVGGFARRATWRVPTKDELLSLVEGRGGYYLPYIDQSMFPNTVSDSYWSSTVHNTSGAWYVVFGSYSAAEDSNNKSPDYYVRCVSSGS